MGHRGVAVNTPEPQDGRPRSFPGREEFNLLFDVDIANPLLKNNGGEAERLMLLVL